MWFNAAQQDQAVDRLAELNSLHEGRLKMLRQLSDIQVGTYLNVVFYLVTYFLIVVINVYWCSLKLLSEGIPHLGSDLQFYMPFWQNTMKSVKSISSSQSYLLLRDWIEKLKSEVYEQQALFEKLQVVNWSVVALMPESVIYYVVFLFDANTFSADFRLRRITSYGRRRNWILKITYLMSWEDHLLSLILGLMIWKYWFRNKRMKKSWLGTSWLKFWKNQVGWCLMLFSDRRIYIARHIDLILFQFW